MLFKAFTVFCACLLLCQAERLIRYNSQTTSKLKIEATPKFSVCKCSGNKCELDEKAASEGCKMLKERFRYYVYPSGYLMLCEFQPQSCTELVNGKPKYYHIHAIYDTYYLRTSTVYLDEHTPTRLLSQRFTNDPIFAHPMFTQKIEATSITGGITGMPVEFDGELNIPMAKDDKFTLCYDGECHKVINEVCQSFSKLLKDSLPVIMNDFLGCHVKHIYKEGNQMRATWAIMFHYHQLVKSGKIKTVKDLSTIVEKVKALKKLPSIVKSFKVVGIHPLDYCEISATATTTLKFHHYMEDATSNIYRTYKEPLYSSLSKQLRIGDRQGPSCVRNILATRLIKDGDVLKLKADLWVSLTCYRKRGLKSCGDVTKEIENVWNNGSIDAYNPWTPKYYFKMLYQGLPLNP